MDLKGKNVEINPLETKSYNKHEEVKKGFSGSFSPKGISASKGMDMAEIFNNKYFKGEGYISADVSGVVWSKKINDGNNGIHKRTIRKNKS